jgi:hypothetical protein
MMKKLIFTGVLVLASAMTGEAMAACSGTQITDPNPVTGTGGSTPTLTTLLTGNSMCQTLFEVAQEQHVSGGVLQDYKKGPFDAKDKTTQIGTWAVSGTGVRTIVKYTYGTDSYVYKVYLVTGTAGHTGSTYDFCDVSLTPTVKATATYRPGFGSTSSYAPVCP